MEGVNEYIRNVTRRIQAGDKRKPACVTGEMYQHNQENVRFVDIPTPFEKKSAERIRVSPTIMRRVDHRRYITTA